MIFEQFINFGVLTLQQVVEQIQNDQKNGNNFDLVKAQVIEVFIKLYEDNLIMYSERVSEEENTYKPIINMSLLGNKDKLKKNKKSVQKEKETAKTEKRGKSNKKKKKEARVQVILECTEQKNSGVPGMSRYITTKNRKNTPDRLELMKYNPYLKKYTLHKEIK